MITFYPGPSKLYPQIEGYMQDAFRSGILSMNHRSAAFMDLLKNTIELLHQKLNIPEDYSIYFTSSATENWEIVAQSLTQKHSEHHYNGAFGKKWFYYTSKLVPDSSGSLFQLENTLDYDLFELENRAAFNRDRLAEAEIICLVQNETSNGTQIKTEALQKIRNTTDALIAIDVTSSLGGIALNWSLGDVWLASVQKCLGLPSGMGVLICSDRALERARKIDDNLRYNSLLFIDENFKVFQTHYTPNILNIYLLNRVLEQVPNITETDLKIRRRAAMLYAFFEKHSVLKPLVQNPDVRSDTVLAITAEPNEIQKIKLFTAEKNIILGNGYGVWKNSTFRIANFPAIDDEDVKTLMEVV